MVRSLILFLLLLPTPALAQSPQAGSRPVLLDFSIPGCAPCRQMDPVVARLQQEGFDVRKVDASQRPDVARQHRVELYPTFVLLVDGREVWRASGLVDGSVLRTSLVNATQMRAAQLQATQQQTNPPGIVPAAFDTPQAPAQNASFQVGGDLGPAGSGPLPAQLLASSVRIRVADPQANSFGTGTIIDTRQGEALVLTCGHLFRDQAAPGAVSVELFEAAGGAPRVVDRAPGRVIAVDLENDVALVTLRPNRPVRAARVAASLGAVTAGAPVWSVGCDLGADPTVRTSRVIGVNRTHRPPNITSTGAPVQGRSGGGLFNAAGEVVGVCFGADNKVDEGLYADLVSIHAQLDKVGLSEIYRAAPAAAPSTVASASTVPARPLFATPATVSATTPVPAPPVVRAQNVPPPASEPNFDLAGLSANERAALGEIGRRAAESEVICIVRPKQPGGRSEVISLDTVSPAFMQALRQLEGVAR